MALRYALIIGNNIGVDGHGSEPFPRLKFAEREAVVLKKKLIQLSNFDSSRTRTHLLTGAARQDVKDAIRSLSVQKAEDERLFGDTDSLFLFYFTGHGLEGQLLMEDGPISADEIGAFFRTLGADFSVGVFDACYSGSLKNAAFESKGLTPNRGFNLFRELPEEVLSAEGSIWYVSSGPGQASYEDKSIGGVFTHFFIEALNQAPQDGPGITLDRIWDYARHHTVEFTSKRDRRQVPEQFIAKLKTNAPIYFSFPTNRSATLVFSESIEGQFVLSYAVGQFTEIIQKRAGKTQKMAVYPGRARLMLIRHGKGRTVTDFYLAPNTALVLRQLPEETPNSAVGKHAVDLWEKGIGVEHTIKATAVESGISALGGVGYEYDYSDETVLLPQHGFSVKGRFDYAKLIVDLSIGYGLDKRSWDWSYRADAIVAGLQVGYGIDLDKWRLSAAAGFEMAAIWQRFSDAPSRRRFSFRPSLHIGALFPTNSKALFELFVHGGPTRSPLIASDGRYVWHMSGGGGMTVYYRLQ